MIPWQHQTDISHNALEIIQENGLVYLAMQERTGKTLTALLVCEKLPKDRILVLTKKKALKGWCKTLKNWSHTKNYEVTNYHQAKKIKNDYDYIILDEAHEYISGFPKPSQMWQDVKALTQGVPLIYLSATPHGQGYQLLFHQLALSDWSVWKQYSTFYAWHRKYAVLDRMGATEKSYVGGRYVETYKRINAEKVLSDVSHLFITKTRAELHFSQEPQDELHYVDIGEQVKRAYNHILKHKLLTISSQGKEYEIVADSPMKLRCCLHQLEGGTLKINKKQAITLANDEKIKYIKENWGDQWSVVIMYNYVQEKIKLEAQFKKATILQATSYAEGVDLSCYAHLIIYSQNFSVAKHTQRRARQANKNREEEIKVHFILTKGGISEQVYESVSSKKKNFVDSVFNKKEYKI
tara:strand:+ start:1433 stop:2659 length:1227 start_codon:yes stop_codon:yes gene_type:complete